MDLADRQGGTKIGGLIISALPVAVSRQANCCQGTNLPGIAGNHRCFQFLEHVIGVSRLQSKIPTVLQGHGFIAGPPGNTRRPRISAMSKGIFVHFPGHPIHVVAFGQNPDQVSGNVMTEHSSNKIDRGFEGIERHHGIGPVLIKLAVFGQISEPLKKEKHRQRSRRFAAFSQAFSDRQGDTGINAQPLVTAFFHHVSEDIGGRITVGAQSSDDPAQVLFQTLDVPFPEAIVERNLNVFQLSMQIRQTILDRSALLFQAGGIEAGGQAAVQATNKGSIGSLDLWRAVKSVQEICRKLRLSGDESLLELRFDGGWNRRRSQYISYLGRQTNAVRSDRAVVEAGGKQASKRSIFLASQ